jgi:hypothetical protein
MATIEQLYQQILGRPADPGGLAYYQNLFGPTIEPEEVNRFLSGAVASREVADIGQLQPAAQSFISSLSRPAQSEADIRRQVEADVAEFIRARDAGRTNCGYRASFRVVSQFTCPSKPRNCRRLNNSLRRLWAYPLQSLTDMAGIKAVKDVYNASVGTPVVQPMSQGTCF